MTIGWKSAAVAGWLVMALVEAARAQVAPWHLAPPSRLVEIGFGAGLWIADVDIGRDINAAGGEALIGRLGHSAVATMRIGVHTPLVGVDGVIVGGSRHIGVRSESGVRFPNHGEPPAVLAGQALLYPFRRALNGGRIRPFLSAAVAAALVSADLDNIDDQTRRLLPGRQFGAGVKWIARDEAWLVDLHVSHLHLHGVRPFQSSQTWTVTVGFGRRL